jgi:hypothetical protein
MTATQADVTEDSSRPRDPAVDGDNPPAKDPLYWRALRLRTLRPNGWQRFFLVEGVVTVAVVLVLADAASAWTLLVLPLASVLVVKGHDLLAGWLRGDAPTTAAPSPGGDGAVGTGEERASD